MPVSTPIGSETSRSLLTSRGSCAISLWPLSCPPAAAPHQKIGAAAGGQERTKLSLWIAIRKTKLIIPKSFARCVASGFSGSSATQRAYIAAPHQPTAQKLRGIASTIDAKTRACDILPMLAVRPLVWLASAFGAGLIAGRFIPLMEWPLWLVAAAAAGWCLASVRNQPAPSGESVTATSLSASPAQRWLDAQGRERLLFCLGGIAFLAGWARQVEYSSERNRLSALIPDFFQAEIAISVPPDLPLADNTGRWVCAGHLLSVNGAMAPSLPVRVAGAGTTSFGRGDILRGWVAREAARPPAYPAAFDLARYLESQGYAAALRFTLPGGRGAENTYAVTPAPRRSALRLVQEMRGAAIKAILTSFPSPEGIFLAAITFGYRPPPRGAEGFAELQDNFRRAGIAHVMAISGMNVALVVAMIWWLLSFLLSRRLIALAAMATCLLYLLLSGMDVSAVRATLMAIIHLGGYLIGRRGDLLNSLAAAALLITAYNPGAILDIGFQLSFTAVLFLVLLGEDLAPRPDEEESRPQTGSRLWRSCRRLWQYLVGLFAMSMAATIGCTPLVAYHFLQLSLIGLLANIVVVPLSTLVLAAGLLAPAAACPVLPLSAMFTDILVAPTVLLIRLAEFCSHLPLASVSAAPLPGWAMALYYAGFAAFFLRKARSSATWQTSLRALALAAVILAVLAMFYCGTPRKSTGASRLWIAPTARGEAVLALTPAGELFWFAAAPRLTEAERVAAGLGLRGPIRLIDLRTAAAVNLDLCQAQSVRSEDGKVAGAVVRCGEVSAAVWLAAANGEKWREFCEKSNSLSAQVVVTQNQRLRAVDLRMLAAKIKFAAGSAARSGSVGVERRSAWGVIRLEEAGGVCAVAAYDGNQWRPLSLACAATRNPLAKVSASGP